MIPTGAPASPTVGIIGAGQPARMTDQAAIPLGVRVRLLAERADDVVLGSPASEPALAAFAAESDVLTFGHELVDADALERLDAAGNRVREGVAIPTGVEAEGAAV